MKPGTKVKMSQALKESLKRTGCNDHVVEFGNCVGIVEGYVNYGNQIGPEVDVQWLPSKLRYTYHPNHLSIIDQ